MGNNTARSVSSPQKNLFWLRWALLIVSIAALFLALGRNFEPDAWLSDIGVLLLVGLIANIVYTTMLYTHSLRSALPYTLLIGDIAYVAIFAYLAAAQPALIVGLITALALLARPMLVEAIAWAHGAGLLLVSAGSVYFVLGSDALMATWALYLSAALAPIVLIVALNVWAGWYEQIERRRQRQVRDVTLTRNTEIARLREQVRTITEMSNALSSTLNFKKLLDVALDIGPLALRKRNVHRFVGMVLLFKPDETLYIANSRGLSHLQENRVLEGKSGMIAEALETARPVISANPGDDPELGTFVAFSDLQSALVVPLRARFENYGVLVFGADQPNAFSPDMIDTLTAVGVQATIALQNSVLYGNLMQEKERIIELEEDARKALVRDLHDVPTQTISAITMRLRIIKRLLERNPEEVPEELEQVEQMSMRVTEEIRHVLFKLRPLALESQGLAAALNQLAEKMQRTYRQAVSVRVAPGVEKALDDHQQGVLFYLIEEAVNNARKYANAELISVELMKGDNVIVVRIADNGVGFDLDAVQTDYDKRSSFGMVNMRERAELLDGTLDIQSAVGRGTIITVTIPLGEVRRSVTDTGPIPLTKLREKVLRDVERP